MLIPQELQLSRKQTNANKKGTSDKHSFSYNFNHLMKIICRKVLILEH